VFSKQRPFSWDPGHPASISMSGFACWPLTTLK
jgi:hypothetical protein